MNKLFEKNKSAVILNPERSEWVSRSHVTGVELVANDGAKTKRYSAKRDLYGDFAYAQPLKMTALTFLLSLNLSTAWAGEHVCIGSTGKWKDTGESCVKCGNDCNWELIPVVDSNNNPVYVSGTTQAQTLNITGSGAMDNWEYIDWVPWYSAKPTITDIEISSDITSIGRNAFKDMSKVTGALIIPDSITSIGTAAFNSMYGVTSLTIPDSVISIGGSQSAMTGITELVIPDTWYDADFTINDWTFFYSCFSAS